MAQVPVAAVSFADVTRSAGIDFHLTCGGLKKAYIMESMCGGIAVLDYDNDGWMDIFLVNGSTLEDLRAGRCHPSKLYRNNHDGTFSEVTAKAGLTHCGWGFGAAVGDYDNDGWMDIFLVNGSTLEDLRAGKCHPSRLYRNNHDGTFSEVTTKAGLTHCGWGFGAAVGDYDNDGWEDLYVTYLDGGVLYHNNHDGTFTDVTAKSGAGNAGRWGTSAAFGDYDNDGRLDLYIANYVDLDLNHLPEFGDGAFCTYRGIAVSCGPRGLKGGRDRLYHNNGDGTFTDVSEKLGMDPGPYYGLGVVWLDYDLDGCLDLYVANDSNPSLLYHNNCKGGFTEVGAESGTAYSTDGREQAGMGVDSADYDNDGWPDIAKTNFSDDTNNLYHNDHSGEFTDTAGPSKFGPVSMPFLGFGVRFLDFDNDGSKDVFIANGHVNPQVDEHPLGLSYAQRFLLFRNLGGGKFSEIGTSAGEVFSRKLVARGLATADFWNRGQEDVLISVLDGEALLLKNQTTGGGHWLRIKTVGTASNRDGFGARVEVKAGGKVQTAEVRANSSYESASDPRLHFGLGAETKVDSITVHWPSGKVNKLGPQAVDKEIVVKEND